MRAAPRLDRYIAPICPGIACLLVGPHLTEANLAPKLGEDLHGRTNSHHQARASCSQSFIQSLRAIAHEDVVAVRSIRLGPILRLDHE
jgi:hypothetical protein